MTYKENKKMMTAFPDHTKTGKNNIIKWFFKRLSSSFLWCSRSQFDWSFEPNLTTALMKFSTNWNPSRSSIVFDLSPFFVRRITGSGRHLICLHNAFTPLINKEMHFAIIDHFLVFSYKTIMREKCFHMYPLFINIVNDEKHLRSIKSNEWNKKITAANASIYQKMADLNLS